MPVGQVPTPQASHQASQARPGLRCGHVSCGREIRSFPNGRLTHATAPQRAREQQPQDLNCNDLESGEKALCGGRSLGQ